MTEYSTRLELTKAMGGDRSDSGKVIEKPSPAYLAAAAGFLHDVGKVGQRGYPPGGKGVEEYFKDKSGWQEENKDLWLRKKLGPTQQGEITFTRFSHYHVLWSGYLCEELGMPYEWKPITQAVYAHHTPSPNIPFSEILAHADRLASGMDRIKEPEKGDAWTTPLRPVLSEVGLGATGEDRGPDFPDCGFPLAEGLNLVKGSDEAPCHGSGNELPFPRQGLKLEQSQYQNLWKEILKEAREIRPGGNPDLFVSRIAGLIEWHCWSVHDSSYGTRNDISLADHSRAVATIAAALARIAQEYKGDDYKDWSFQDLFGSYKSLSEGKPTGLTGQIEEEYGCLFKLVVGDLRGIQRFIYDVYGEGTAKQLRARSLTVEIWCDRLAAHICRQVGIPEACRVYATGGKFLLLLPNLKRVIWEGEEVELDTFLARFQDKVNQEIEQFLGGRIPLRLVLASVDLCQADLISGKLKDRLDELMANLNINSGQPRRGQPEEGFFDPQAPPEEYVASVAGAGEIREDVDKFFIGMGGALTRLEFWFESELSIPISQVKKWGDELPIPGTGLAITLQIKWPAFKINSYDPNYGFRWYAGEQIARWPENIESNSGKSDDPNESFWAKLFRLAKDEWARLAGERKEDRGEPKGGQQLTFGDLANAAELLNGFGRLGVLRLDVDNLGYIISRGLDRLQRVTRAKNVYSLSRIASLSSSLVRFFSGLLPKLLDFNYRIIDPDFCNSEKCLKEGKDGKESEEQDKGEFPLDERVKKEIPVVKAKDLVTVIYAGGDDCFLVGPWDLLAQVAFRIREGFHCWTCGNPDLGLSGGLFLMDGHYPIRVGARKAGELEEEAKSEGLRRNIGQASLSQSGSGGVNPKQSQLGPFPKDHFNFLECVAPWWVRQQVGGWSYIQSKRKALECLVMSKMVDNRSRSAILRMLGKVAMTYLRGERNSKRLQSADVSTFLDPLPGFWKPMFTYALNRQGEEIREKLDCIFGEMIPPTNEEDQRQRYEEAKQVNGGIEPISYLPTIVRWAELRTRRWR